jgi:hypothetical protein
MAEVFVAASKPDVERFQFPWNLKAALFLCIVAFSRREVVSTSLENALVSSPRAATGFGGAPDSDLRAEVTSKARESAPSFARFLAFARFLGTG